MEKTRQPNKILKVYENQLIGSCTVCTVLLYKCTVNTSYTSVHIYSKCILYIYAYMFNVHMYISKSFCKKKPLQACICPFFPFFHSKNEFVTKGILCLQEKKDSNRL